MRELGMRVARLTTMIGARLLLEPQFFWPDALSPFHLRAVTDAQRTQYADRPPDEEARARVRGEHVGFVFQTFRLLASLTAVENVMLPAELRGDAGAQAQAQELLDRVGLADRASHYPRQLSGGEQQRVGIARAFASRPTVLFADEPTGNLDTRTGARVIELLFRLNEEFDTTLVLVTHDDRLADRCGRVVELDAGRILA